MCGEKRKEVAEYASKAGSPPRVRGKVEPFKGSMHQSRITPACAGKRTSPAGRRTVSWDHPRVCGEKLRETGVEDALVGITPACAGKSPASGTRTRTGRDHPRVCGEKSCTRFSSFWMLGSPPRVRGKGVEVRLDDGRTRITPACAGKSAKPVFNFDRLKDHPRVCGEKSSFDRLQVGQ